MQSQMTIKAVKMAETSTLFYFGKLLYRPYKSQLISEGLFGILNSSKKTNEKIRLNYHDTSGRLVFVRYLVRI